jgi:hypothetical protein
MQNRAPSGFSVPQLGQTVPWAIAAQR